MLDTRRRAGYLLLVVVLCQVVLISAQVNTASGRSVLGVATFGAFAEIQRATASTLGGVRELWYEYVALRGIREENAHLREEMADLRVRLQERRALVERATDLERLLDLRRTLDQPTVAVQVLAADATPWFRSVTVDKGSASGLRADLPVLAPAGVVGRIVNPVGESAARVQLIIDRNAGAGAMIERSRARGVVIGVDGDPPLRMEYVSNLEDVQVGDAIVTSGLDGIYPGGFLIGRVQMAEPGSGLHQDIAIQPAVDFTRLDALLVILAPELPAIGAEGDP